MIRQSEGFFKGYNGSNLFFQRWTADNPKATLVITHGQAEHSGCYTRLVNALADTSLDIIAWDLRGHGRSDGLRGYAKDLNEYIKDFECFLKKLTMDFGLTSKPIFLVGHSMGALIQMRTLCERPQMPVTAQIMSSPMFGISVPVPAFKDKAASWINMIAPKLTLGNEIRFESLTHDAQIIREFENDSLRHNKISAGVYLSSKSTMSEVRAMATRVKTPSLLLMSTDDPVTSTPDALEIYDRIGAEKKQKHLYLGRGHETFNDLGRDEVYADLKKFISEF